MTQGVPLSDFQRRALDAMGIQLWVPRRDLPLAGPVEWRVATEKASDHRLAIERQAPVAVTHGGGDAIGPKPSSSPAQHIESSAEASIEAVGPAIRFQSLSLKSRECHVLIDDATYAEGAFWRDLLLSVHGFDLHEPIRENRFDWPLPGLRDASADAAQKALRGYLNQDRFVCVRGDTIANLLFGAGKWQSFPEKHRLADAEIWVFGSDLILKDVETRRSIWKSIESLELP